MEHENAFVNNDPGQSAEMESRLWAYIDGVSEEPTVIQQLLSEQTAWQEKYAELLAVQQLLLEATELEQPSLRFTKNVMEEIARLQVAPAAKEYINKKIIWGVSLFFVALFALVAGYGLLQVNWSSGSAPAYDVKLPVPDLSWLWSGPVTTGFLFLNLVLGLFFLDRYLARKRRDLRGENA